ncbi:MAG: hypothetical protein GYA12_10610 [Chloroflexi bacterium]|jgi:hypothetical protein|nr:hypothetical protein [Chloroflexota bacterium]BCY17034.1 hypothetical protein hrd7_08830 [Leptolinea sp. HRD-7]
MADFETIVKKNAESLAEMQDFLSTLTESELSTPMPAGWTVSAVLCHLMFWDQRALTLLEKWEKEDIAYSTIDTDVVNEVTRFLCLAVPAEKAVQLFLQTAEILDKRISRLEPDRIKEIEEKGKNVRLLRADHREMHLADIKKVLGR